MDRLMTESPALVACHECGYDIPPVVETICPECGNIWTNEHARTQEQRRRVLDRRSGWIGNHALVWLGVLFVYALGGFVTDRFNPKAFIGIFLGIGFGIFLSNALGLLIAMMATKKERMLYQWVWVRTVWWAHAPWLAIGPLTLIGSLLGGFFRLVNPDLGSDIFIAVLMPIFVGWLIFCIVAAYLFTRRHSRSCASVGISKSNRVVTLHSVWAFMIMLGSGAVALMGGMMGVFFIEWVLTGTDDSFMIN